MEKLQRIFIVDARGVRQTLCFDISRFVSYNVDTRELVLESGCYRVHKDSEERLICAYRTYFGGVYEGQG